MNDSLRNTLQLVLGVELLSVPAGVLLALLLQRTDLPLRRTNWVLLLASVFLPLYLQAAAWDAGFGRQGGWTYQSSAPVEPWLAGMRAAVFLHALAALPWATVLAAASLRFGSPDWEELALLDASPARVFWTVVAPRAAPGALAAALWIGVTTAGEMAVTDMYRVRTYAESIYLDLASGATLDELLGGATGNLATAGVLAAAAAVAVWIVSSPRQQVPAARTRRFSLGAARLPLAVGVTGGLAALWCVPAVNLIYNAGVEVRSEGERRVREWSAANAWRQAAVAPREFSSELGWTFLIGGSAATVATAAAIPLAWRARRSRVAIAVGAALSAAAAAVPGPLLSLLLLTWRDESAGEWAVRLFDDTAVVLILVHAWRAAPIVWLLAVDAMRTYPEAEWEQAAIEGAGPWRRWWTRVLPRRRGAILVAWIGGLGVSFSEVSTSLLVGPQGVTTAAVRTFQLVHTGVDDRLAGLALVLIGLGWLLTAGVLIAARGDLSDEAVGTDQAGEV